MGRELSKSMPASQVSSPSHQSAARMALLADCELLRKENEKLSKEIGELQGVNGQLSEELGEEKQSVLRLSEQAESVSKLLASLQDTKQHFESKMKESQLELQNMTAEAKRWEAKALSFQQNDEARATEMAEVLSRTRADSEHRWKMEAEAFERDKAALQAKNGELQSRTVELEQRLWKAENQNQEFSKVANAACSGCRLRATLTKQGASIEELSSAILSVEALVEEARRELNQKELREKRAATEQMHHAMDLRLDEDALVNSIDRARKAGVSPDDVEKAEGILAELRAMSPEERANRLASRAERQSKDEAFTFAKRDRVEELEKLLDSLAPGVVWENWHDSQGRTLLRVAQQLRSERARKVLEQRIEKRQLGAVYQEDPILRRSSREQISMIPRITEKTEEFDSSTSMTTTQTDTRPPLLGEAAMVTSLSGGRVPPSPGNGVIRQSLSRTNSGEVPPSPHQKNLLLEEVAVPGVIAEEEKESPMPATSIAGTTAASSWSWYDDDNNSGGSNQKDKVATVKEDTDDLRADFARPSPEEEEKLKTEAFRACARGDAEKLAEVLEQLPTHHIWVKWRNKAGKDLEELCQERGEKCEGALRVIYKASGREQTVVREYYEEGTYIWVHLKGDVQAKQATVMQDTPEEDDYILIQYWIGYDEPEYVDRSMVSRMPAR